MTDSVPARAPGGPPLIGQSTRPMPFLPSAAASSSTNGTPTVQVLITVLTALPLMTPSSPRTTLRRLSSVGSDTITVAH